MDVKNGSLKLFRLFGINVFLNWTWILGPVYFITSNTYFNAKGAIPHSLPFLMALYLCLFLIVLIHEFGHALACKSVGGRADRIVLQPLGGIAFVDPPQRPGAMLWSIVAGPLVNVILLPVTIIPAIWLYNDAIQSTAADFVIYLAAVNASLLIFNLLPFYPLDGGQIFRSLLWFVCGRGLSLIIAAAVGIVGAVLLALWAFVAVNPLLGAIVLFMGFQSFNAIKIGIAQYRLEKMPRHPFVRCPLCLQHPPMAPIWRCRCGSTFDTFQSHGRCPNCATAFESTACPFCNRMSLAPLWHANQGFPVQAAPVSPNPNFSN